MGLFWIVVYIIGIFVGYNVLLGLYVFITMAVAGQRASGNRGWKAWRSFFKGMTTPNYQAMQVAGAKKKQAVKPGDVKARYMAGGSWLNNMSTGKPSRNLK